jgi:ribonuclease-3
VTSGFAISYQWHDPSLRQRALTHKSAVNDPQASYERLEFLGDRILGLILSEYLCQRFPHASEGELAKRLNALVQQKTLAKVAESWKIAAAANLGNTDNLNRTGAIQESILADMVEALIAALYLDGGLEAARSAVLAAWQPLADQDLATPTDPKSALQEWSQGRGLPIPTYRVLSQTGSDHHPTFVVEVVITGWGSDTAEGPSKKAAERLAAQKFLARVVQ